MSPGTISCGGRKAGSTGPNHPMRWRPYGWLPEQPCSSSDRSNSAAVRVIVTAPGICHCCRPTK
jgi:hypothetical protein